MKNRLNGWYDRLIHSARPSAVVVCVVIVRVLSSFVSSRMTVAVGVTAPRGLLLLVIKEINTLCCTTNYTVVLVIVVELHPPEAFAFR